MGGFELGYRVRMIWLKIKGRHFRQKKKDIK
jgi:hypothetical protein